MHGGYIVACKNSFRIESVFNDEKSFCLFTIRFLPQWKCLRKLILLRGLMLFALGKISQRKILFFLPLRSAYLISTPKIRVKTGQVAIKFLPVQCAPFWYSEMHRKWKCSSAIRVQASLILKIIICLTLRRVSY